MVEYLEETGDESSSHSRLQSPARAPRSSSGTPTPAKLAPTHSLFMASIDNSPTRRKTASGLTANDGLSNSYGGPHLSAKSSTKVIESLHDQIDTLTNTNLQLTIQSNNLLSKLENAQQRESKLLENTSSLKHENDNLESMLNRKTRKLKDLEEELNQLKLDHSLTLEEKSKYEYQCKQISEKEKEFESKMEMVQAQYDALVDSQNYYKMHYKSQLGELQKELENMKIQQREYLERVSRDSKVFDSKLHNFNATCEELRHAEVGRIQYFDNKCDEILKQFNVDDWVNLYKESRKMVLTYAERMELDISPNFQSLSEDTTLASSENKPQFNNNGKSVSSEGGSQPLKMVKIRNRSGTNNSASKRSSFYGASKQVTSASLPGTLPGIRRSSSRRANSGKSEPNSSSESSPKLSSSASRNASSPSPRMIHSSTFRKKNEA